MTISLVAAGVASEIFGAGREDVLSVSAAWDSIIDYQLSDDVHGGAGAERDVLGPHVCLDVSRHSRAGVAAVSATVTCDASRTNVVDMIAAGVGNSIVPIQSWQRSLRLKEVYGFMVWSLAALRHETNLSRTIYNVAAEVAERLLKLRDERFRIGSDLILEAPNLAVNVRDPSAGSSLCSDSGQ